MPLLKIRKKLNNLQISKSCKSVTQTILALESRSMDQNYFRKRSIHIRLHDFNHLNCYSKYHNCNCTCVQPN